MQVLRFNNHFQAGNQYPIERFLKDREVKKTSTQLYTYALKSFISFLERANIIEPTKSDIRAYKEYLLQKYKRGSASVYFNICKEFIKWLAGEKLIACDITSNIKNIKLDDSSKRNNFLSDYDISDILSSFNNLTLEDIRNRAIFALFLSTGLRASELVNANIGDIQQKGDSTIIYILGKGRTEKSDFVIIPFKVMAIIRQYLKYRNNVDEEAPLFSVISNRNINGRLTRQALYSIVKKVYAKANIKQDFCIHSLRHTAITQALKEGASLQEVQQMARHKNINTTLIYSHNIELLSNTAGDRLANKYL